MGEWKKFISEGRGVAPKIGIRKGGQIGLNISALKKFKLDNYKYVVFFINEDDMKIGIKPINSEMEEGACKLRISKSGVSVSAKNFINTYNLENIKKTNLICEWDNENEMIIAKYNK